MNTIEDLINRINELETENAALYKWQDSVNRLLNQMLDMITDQAQMSEKHSNEIAGLKQYANINRYRINSLPYELQDPDYHSFYFKPKILSKQETRRQIAEKRRSIARLGDGEFAAIVGQKRWNFQSESEVLGEKLKKVLEADEGDILIGLNPTFYMNLFDLPEDDADGVRAYMHPMVRRLHADLLNPDKQYADALFHNMYNNEDVKELKQIWNNRDCVFIEGIHTCMGVGNDLFDNCNSIERIVGPAENAVEKYDEIMKEALNQTKDKLLLIALGPTATALAYDLYKEGYQAVDIGHIDLIYESYVRKLPNVYGVNIPYKYCSIDERVSGRIIEEPSDAVYQSQIIARIQ